MSPDAGIYPHDKATELQALLRKLSDIGDEIACHRQRLEQLTLEFHRVDAAIRAASASAPPAAGQPLPDKSVPNRVLDVLAGARNPMSAREIAHDILKPQGLDESDPRIRSMTHRVSVSLWVQNQKGLVRKIEHSPSRFRWELMRA